MRLEIDAALAKVAAKHGITLEIGNISFSADSFRTTLSAKSSADPLENAKSDFIKSAYSVGLLKDAFGKTFDVRGDTFKIIGVKPRSHKYPVIGKDMSNGKEYKLPLSYVPSNLKESWAA